MPHDYYSSKETTLNRNTARMSSTILETLDECAPQFFDFLEVESVTLQNKLEAKILEALQRFAKDLEER